MPVLAAASDVSLAIEVLYGVEDSAKPAGAAETDREMPASAEVHLNALLVEMVELGASDLHLSSGLPPCIRVDGHLRPMDGYEPLTPSELRRMVYAILTQRQREKFEGDARARHVPLRPRRRTVPA